MTITITLGSKTAISLACEFYLEEKIKKKCKLDEDVILTISKIISDTKFQEYWIKKGFKLKN